MAKHPDLQELEVKWGTTINKASDLYSELKKHAKYSYYYNDRYDNRKALSLVKQGQGINCTDYCQLLKPMLESINYKAKIEHVKVKCRDNKWYGHYLLRISGGPKNVQNLIFDAVSATKTGRELGDACCTEGFQHLGWGIS